MGSDPVDEVPYFVSDMNGSFQERTRNCEKTPLPEPGNFTF
jgi:hypothetical protein